MNKKSKIFTGIILLLLFVLAILVFFIFKTNFSNEKNNDKNESESYFSDSKYSTAVKAKLHVESTEIKDDTMGKAENLIKSLLESRGYKKIKVNYNNLQKVFQLEFYHSNYYSEDEIYRLFDLIVTPHRLYFCEGTSNDIPSMTDDDIESAESNYDEEMGTYVQLNFTSEGMEKFETLTAKNVGKTVSIWLDDILLSQPTVNEAISSESAFISMFGEEKETADELAAVINFSKLKLCLTYDKSDIKIK